MRRDRVAVFVVLVGAVVMSWLVLISAVVAVWKWATP